MDIDKTSKSILEVAARYSGNRRLTIQEISMESGVDESTIHNKMQDEEFRGLFIETARNSLISDVPEILNAFSEQAKAGSYQHGKLILELTGLYTDTKNIVADVGMSEREGKSAWKNKEERDAFLRETLKGALDEESDKDA